MSTASTTRDRDMWLEPGGTKCRNEPDNVSMVLNAMSIC